jgi:hypothetical protein
MTSAAMAGWRGRRDAMDLAWRVPVAVLGSALGVPSADIDTVVSLSGQLCDALAPRTRAWPGGGRRSPAADGDAAATALATVLAKSAGAGDCAVAAASILFQARDATAGLIGLAVSAAVVPGGFSNSTGFPVAKQSNVRLCTCCAEATTT